MTPRYAGFAPSRGPCSFGLGEPWDAPDPGLMFETMPAEDELWDAPDPGLMFETKPAEDDLWDAPDPGLIFQTVPMRERSYSCA